MGDIVVGKVVSIKPEKGFFFLRNLDNTGPEYFAHKDDLPRGFHIEDLNEGMAFEFEPLPDNPKGPRACNLRVPKKRRSLDDLLADA